MEQRIIKFRAWHTQLKTMFYPETNGEFVGENEDGDRVCSDFDYSNLLNSDVDYPYIPMQFTGLTDKNGVEIYEGDIVKMDKKYGTRGRDYDTMGAVEYISTAFKCRGYGDCFGMNYDIHGLFEVIGNVFTNPELLP